MLKNIPEIISPDLMKALMEMGHGDEIVIGDINFPQKTMSQRCVYLKGHEAPEIVEAIMKFFPLDQFVDDPVVLMQPDPKFFQGTPPIWAKYEKIIKENDTTNAFKGFTLIDRFDFYPRAQKAFVTVGTSEPGLYACMILKKGVIGKSSAD